MHGHLARRAFACLFGSLLLGVIAAHAQQLPFPYQLVSYSATLDNPEAGSATGFGDSVGIEGLTMLAGIPYYGPNDVYGFPTGQGRVAVFTADAATGEVWTRTGSIENPNPVLNVQFGLALAIQHDRAVVEAPYDLYVFDKHGAGAAQTWDLRATIALPAPVINTPPPVEATEFNYGPMAYDDGVVAAAVTESLDVNGGWQTTPFVYLYEVGWDGHTRLLEKLPAPQGPAGTEPTPGGGVGCAFGASVALEAGTLVVGCPSGAGAGPEPYPPGVTYVFSRRGDHWELQQTLAGSSTNGDDFGQGVAIHRNIILVGASQELYNSEATGSGVVYVYLRKRDHDRDRDCDTWTLSQRVSPQNLIFGGLGTTVAFNDQYAAFGAPEVTGTEGENPGSAFIYKWQGDQLVYDTLAPYGSFGTSLAMSRKRLVIGSEAYYSPFVMVEGAAIIDFDPQTSTNP
jgi:hypothetical protein